MRFKYAVRGREVPARNFQHVRTCWRAASTNERPARPDNLSWATVAVPWLVYDEHTPQIWRVPLFDQLLPALYIDVPRGGYIVDGGFAKQVAAVLDLHGLVYVPLPELTAAKLDLETYRVTKVTYQPTFEGRTRVALEGAWTPESRTLERGAIFVPAAQPHTRLVMHLLEPALPDSLAQWGQFNAAFEQKEYMEPYIAEQVAREMLGKDPTLRAQFDAALAADAELAKSPAKRLQWFYERSPAWDERVNLLPVYRTARDLRQPPGVRVPAPSAQPR